MHSPKYDKVKSYYDRGIWTKDMVANAVTRAWITAEEYEEITGDPYVPRDTSNIETRVANLEETVDTMLTGGGA